MARIPRYQQGQLASSMVGTPGIDTATATAFQNASTSVGKIGSAIMDVAQADYNARVQEQNRIRTEQRAAAKALDTLQKETQVGGDKAGLSISLNDMDNTMRQESRFSTDGAMAKWAEGAQKLADERLDKIQDPTLKLMTQKAFQTELASKQQQFGDYLNSRIPEIGAANAAKIGDALKLSTNSSDLSVLEVREKLETFSTDPINVKTFENVYGPAAGVKMREYQSSAARNYLAQTASTGNIDLLNERINRFSDIVEGTDSEEFYARQRQLAGQVKVQQEKEIEYNTAVTVNEGLSTIRQKAADGSLTRADVDAYVDGVKATNGTPGAIRAGNTVWTQYSKDETKTATKVVTAQEKETRRLEIAETQKQLNGDYNTLIGKSKGQVGPRKGTTPKDLSGLYADIDQAELQGNVTPEAANTMRRNVKWALKQFDKKEPQAAAHARVLMVESDNILKQAKTYTPDPLLNKVIGVNFNNAYFDTVESFEQRKGRLSTTQERKNLADNLLPKVMLQARQQVDAAAKARAQRIKAQAQKR